MTLRRAVSQDDFLKQMYFKGILHSNIKKVSYWPIFEYSLVWGAGVGILGTNTNISENYFRLVTQESRKKKTASYSLSRKEQGQIKKFFFHSAFNLRKKKMRAKLEKSGTREYDM